MTHKGASVRFAFHVKEDRSMNNIEELVKHVKTKKPKAVLIQVPEGLKTKAIEIAGAIEEEGIKTVICADPCYGACDLPNSGYENMGIDLIVHIGHNKFYKDIKTEKPVLYYIWDIDVDLTGIDFSVIKEKRIGLLTSIQHMNSLESIAELIKKAGKESVVGGQILGCWTENAEKLNSVDAFLFIGSGVFHATALRDKKVYLLDLEKKHVEEIDTKKPEKRRYANIYKCKDAKSFGILVSTKPGQCDMEKAKTIKKELENKDKKAFIVIMNEITNEKLMGINVDAFVNTACPRIVDECFDKPIINAKDLEKLF